MKKPTVARLVKIIQETHVQLVERAVLDGKMVAGYCNEDGIVLCIKGARSWSQADSLVVTLIHEAIHIWDDRHSEAAVRRWETEFFKSRTLREAALIKLLNVTLFKE